MDNDKFKQELARSRVYEVAFKKWLEAEREFSTLPVFDFNGYRHNTAPVLSGNGRQLVAPDILGFKGGGACAFFEVKLKELAALHRKTNTRVTGLALRNWQDYMEISRLTGIPVWIVFIHQKEREVRVGNIRTISEHHIHHESTMDRGGTVFFEYSRLSRIMGLEDLEAYKETHS